MDFDSYKLFEAPRAVPDEKTRLCSRLFRKSRPL